MDGPRENTFACLDRAMLSVQQAIIGGNDQPGAIGVGQCVSIVQKEVHLKHTLNLMALYFHVGTPTPPHRVVAATRMDARAHR